MKKGGVGSSSLKKNFPFTKSQAMIRIFPSVKNHPIRIPPPPKQKQAMQKDFLSAKSLLLGQSFFLRKRTK